MCDLNLAVLSPGREEEYLMAITRLQRLPLSVLVPHYLHDISRELLGGGSWPHFAQVHHRPQNCEGMKTAGCSAVQNPRSVQAFLQDR